jgi:uncharacterized protein (TIGR03000 family)
MPPASFSRWTIGLLAGAVIGLSIPGWSPAQSGTITPYVPPPPPRPREIPVTLVVRLPADAVLEIDGVGTKQQGEVRRFTSPPLQPGRQYTYTLKASWNEKGEAIVRERAVPVRAGTEVVVDFRQAK